MEEPSITFFPVENGDTSLLCLSDGTTILIDCHICENALYDTPTHLLDTLKHVDGVPHVGVFMLTHPHEDHALGLQSICYFGDPAKYSAEDKKKSLIVIDELWFAPRIFNDQNKDMCDDARAFKKEAERRMDLYRSGNHTRANVGNRLRLIGATDNDDCDELDEITTVPGETLNLINGKRFDDFRFFVFAPVKKDSDDDSIGPNNTSIVVQARFDIDGEEEAVRAFFGGDAECPVWERIVDRNEDENLAFDLLLAPHHCSWTVFNANGGDEPSEKVLHLLDQRRAGANVIASSKAIKDDDDNPPSYRAKKVYVDAVGSDHFLCTGEHPNEKDPKPIHFTLSKNGLTKSRFARSYNQSTVAVLSQTTSSPRTYG